MSKQELVVARLVPAVLEERRTQASRLLDDAFADDRLSVEELEQRLQQLHAATDLATIDALVADLVAPEPTRLRAVLGNLERSGVWQVPERLSVSALFANASIDFREAILTSALTVLDIRVVCANLEILVPPELHVERRGGVVLGNWEQHGAALPSGVDGNRLVVRGPIVLGNVEIHRRSPGESAHEARLRAKHAPLRLSRGHDKSS